MAKKKYKQDYPAEMEMVDVDPVDESDAAASWLAGRDAALAVIRAEAAADEHNGQVWVNCCARLICEIEKLTPA